MDQTTEMDRPLWPEAMQALAQALVRAASLEDVAAAVVSYGTAAAGGRCGHVVLLDPRGHVAVSLFGGHAVPSRRLDGVPPDVPLPWSDTVRVGSKVEFPSTEALYESYPDVARTCALPSRGAVVTLPLASAGAACGAVTFGFDDPGPVLAAAHTILAEITALTTHAARRAALYETEQFSAETLQRAYLPASLSDAGGLSFASRFLPAGEPMTVGGDWYDVMTLPGPRVAMVIGDVAGHGIEAATVMASLRAALQAFATVETSPGGILTRLNTFSCLFKPEAFATALVAIFDPADGRLTYASAGHPPPVLAGVDGAVLLAEPLGPALGMPGTCYDDGASPFPPGSRLVAYTDGLVERKDRSIDLSIGRVLRTVEAAGAASPDDLCDRIAFELLAGIDLFDDAALLVVERAADGRASRQPG